MLPDADQHRDKIDAFLAEFEGSFPERVAELGISEEEQWTNYKLLQMFDRMALYFCGFPKQKADDVYVLRPVPTDYQGTETELHLRALSSFEPFAPQHAQIDPYPFAESPTYFTLERRVLPKRRRTSPEFREELLGVPTETVEIRVER